MLSMDNDWLDKILYSLDEIHYKGPLLKEVEGKEGTQTGLEVAIASGLKDRNYVHLIMCLTSELKESLKLNETVTEPSDPDDSDSFHLELRLFLNELNCDHETLITDPAAFNEPRNRLILIDYLLSELMTARLLRVKIEESTEYKRNNFESNPYDVQSNLSAILNVFGVDIPPPHTQERISKAPVGYIGKPLVLQQMSAKQWGTLDCINEALLKEYSVRRQMLLMRCSVTVQSFKWSDRTKGKDESFTRVCQSKWTPLKEKAPIIIARVLAAKNELLSIEKTSSGSVRQNTASDINKVLIGSVPDRGGKLNETCLPPEMPLFKQRTEGPSKKRGGVSMMAWFSKDELSFVKEVPDQIEIECPVCLHILKDPHQVSCCGRNFCKSCIERIKASNGSCPTCMCKEERYQSFEDKNIGRIINGLQVYCTNMMEGCQWKGDLKNISTHLSKEIREGECQFEEVKCRYDDCQIRDQRLHLNIHEKEGCDQRPDICEHCYVRGTYFFITFLHMEFCSKYPTTCPNHCAHSAMPRERILHHLTQCPLEPVDCVFSWAGCDDKPLRKDVHVHTADTKHMMLLAVACGQLKKENEQMKEENEQIKEENEKIRQENEKVREEMMKQNKELKEMNARTLSYIAVMDCDRYPLLPITLYRTSDPVPVHFYTEIGGHHMSATILQPRLYLAFHHGKFDKVAAFSQPKILVKYDSDDAQPVQIKSYRKVNDDIPTHAGSNGTVKNTR
uniref:RING-type domain-containing protein n=1 Tax=Amphimedon queenslandica TaxID=400682 RepID=A0A1X7UK10_AMPQE